MSDKFLNNGGGQNANVSDGSTNIYGSTIGADNLNPFTPVKTNSQNQLVSTNLEISDVNNLQATLNSVITNPYIGTLTASDMRADTFEVFDSGHPYASLAQNNVLFSEPTGIQYGDYGRTVMSIYDNDTKNYQNSSKIELIDQNNANKKNTISRSSLNITSSSTTNSNLTPDDLVFSKTSEQCLYNQRGLNHTGSYLTSTLTPITNTISLKSDENDQNLPRMVIQSDITGVGVIKTITNYESFVVYNEVPKIVSVLNSVGLFFPSLDNIDPYIEGFYGRLSSQIKDASNSNTQTSTTIEINDEKKADVKSTLNKSALNIKSTAIINSNLSSTNLVFTGVGVDGTYTASSIQIKNVNNRNIQTAFSILLNDQVDSSIRIFLTKTSLYISNPTDRNSQTASNIEISDEKTPTIKSTLNKNSLTITDGSIVNSLSNTQLSMIDSSLNRSLLTRLALEFFEPSSTTIPTASLNQTALEIKDTSLTPEISSLTKGFLNINSPINNCVASLSSSTLTMLDIPSTHGTTVDKDLISIIDTAQNISNLTSTFLKLFPSTDQSNPATLLNQTKLEFKDTTGLITSNYGRTLSNIINASDGNRQSASTIEISDEKTANIKSTLTKTSLNIINSSNNTECEITAPQIYMSNIGNTHRLILSKDDISFIDVSANSNVINPISYSLYKTGNLITPVTELNQTSLVLRTTSLTPEIMSLNNSSVSFNSPINSTANSLSNTQLSMIDTSLNRSLLTRQALQLFSPASTTIPTATLNQTQLIIKTASVTPEILTISNGDIIINSPINSCVSSISSSTIAMNDIAITHGVAINKDEFSAIDSDQYVSRLNAYSLRMFKFTDLVNPATLLDNEKLVIVEANDKTTINATTVKVENIVTGNYCALNSASITGINLYLLPDAGTDISLSVSGGGHIFLNGLPTSNVGLPSGALYIHNTGGHNNICVV